MSVFCHVSLFCFCFLFIFQALLLPVSAQLKLITGLTCTVKVNSQKYADPLFKDSFNFLFPVLVMVGAGLMWFLPYIAVFH